MLYSGSAVSSQRFCLTTRSPLGKFWYPTRMVGLPFCRPEWSMAHPGSIVIATASAAAR
ncbi:Uncharacterised protein [Mycobacteroides abscessus subsp. abscessus]|nr:Uncharacterised protein [Mycobacteroides abscessus subsp. abscessus]